MLEISVKGQNRTDIGKKASKLMRKEGLVPCNLYGEKRDENGLPVAKAFAVSFAELRKAVYTPNIYVINLDIEGEKHIAILKELCRWSYEPLYPSDQGYSSLQQDS